MADTSVIRVANLGTLAGAVHRVLRQVSDQSRRSTGMAETNMETFQQARHKPALGHL